MLKLWRFRQEKKNDEDFQYDNGAIWEYQTLVI